MHQLANEQATITDDGKVNVIGPTGVTGLEDRIEAAAARQAEQDGNIFSHNEATSLERNWTEEFEQTKADTTAAPQAAKDWADEFASKVAFDELDEALNNLSEADAEGWVKQYKENIAHLSQEPTDQEWAELQKEWEKYSVNSGGYRATDAALDKYAYTATDANRFASMESSQLDSILNKMHTDPASLELSDSIQALEARVQNNPTDAQAWHQLGLRQQENEQEKQAIAALRTAVRLDPTILDAWTALAVSYTNENYHTDAYVSLLRWMQNSDKYRSLVPPNAEQTVERVDQRHAIVEGMFLDAVELGMSSGDATLDPDVQVALGVLFNISEEYDKAVDCFQAALAHRPTDYVLFNKLGATLANSKSPSRAIDAYFTALEINPSYVRARYNLAISCISLRQYREAAEHLLTALSLQQRAADKIKQGSVSAVAGGGGADGDMAPDNANGTSDNVWDTLKMTLYMMNMPHLAHECRSRNLDTFRQEFQF
ncbi:TPR-like protein [Ramicandelaber brevisporus]|nr:TPR-like protein [Ramicandelaber brevisporus]